MLWLAFAPWAAADGVALVIGNSTYSQGPLENPGNDANAISSALRDAGFEVILGQNLTREQMLQALQTFGSKLSGSRKPGVFYFAGHGVQIDWNNYLIPVDAQPKSAAELRAQAVPLGELFERLGVANNGINLVILDACRDNPFAGYAGAKGLSQTDAPTGTLLAYSTAPGNVALDGAGGSRNSIYTESLLKEMRVMGARVEDVFKRVRLNVRIKSNGKQIPWESTSLEDDFTFFPRKTKDVGPTHHSTESPREDVTSSEASDEVIREEWGAASSQGTVDALRLFLQKRPSSPYSELAQTRLEQLLASVEGRRADVTQLQAMMVTPDASSRMQAELVDRDGSRSRLRSGWEIGDLLVYQEKDNAGFFKRERTLRHRILLVTDGQIMTRSYEKFDLHFNPMVTKDWQWASPAQLLVGDLALGKSWTTSYKRQYRSGAVIDVVADGKVTARQVINVPAGAFETYRVEISGRYGANSTAATFLSTYWVDAISGKPVRYEHLELRIDGKILSHDSGHLTLFENAGDPTKD